MPTQKLKNYLDQHVIQYVTVSHSPAYTAQRITELTEDDEIAFNAGSHSELVKMSYNDFANLVAPKVVALTCARRKQATRSEAPASSDDAFVQVQCS